jgi:alkylhydroperoxidase family enzyme
VSASQQFCFPSIHKRIKARIVPHQLLSVVFSHMPNIPYVTDEDINQQAAPADLVAAPLLRELAICAVAVYNRADYEWLQHAPEFLAAGGRQTQLAALHDIANAPNNVTSFSELERLVITLTQEMTQSIEVSAATMQSLRQHLNAREVVEIVGVIAAYNMVSRFLVALQIEPE